MYEKYKQHFLNVYNASKVSCRTFPHHVDVVAAWAEKLCDLHPEADRDVAVVAAWFHDLGHFTGEDEDHALSSEKEALKFLETEGFSEEKKNKILHAVRAHRNRDVKPETIEAKIVCCADSASHLTAEVYLTVLRHSTKEKTLSKLERDYRDLSEFPEIKKELMPLCLAWKGIIESFPDEFTGYIPK